METKICKTCEEPKPIDNFHKTQQADGTIKISLKCAKCTKEYNRQKHLVCTQKQKGQDKEAYAKRHRERVAKWRRENSEKARKTNREYLFKRYKEDAMFRMAHNMRCQVRDALNGRRKYASTFAMLGYSQQELFEHLKDGIEYFIQAKIKYAIDHKIPLEWFKADTPLHISYDLKNLQVLSEEENRAKKHLWPSITDKQYLEEIRPYIKEEYLCW